MTRVRRRGRPAAPQRRLEMVGWWFHERAPDHWPRPQALVGRWRAAERAAVLHHLRAGSTLMVYPRRSTCRFACGERAMGNRDLTDGVFVWPEGLAHYVERHDVRLPRRFVAAALAAARGRRAHDVPDARACRYDAGPWLRWARARSACVDLAGWEVPDPRSRRRIRAELGRMRGVMVLCRAATREVVLARRDGSLVIVTRRGDGTPPRRLRDWNEWP